MQTHARSRGAESAHAGADARRKTHACRRMHAWDRRSLRRSRGAESAHAGADAAGRTHADARSKDARGWGRVSLLAPVVLMRSVTVASRGRGRIRIDALEEVVAAPAHAKEQASAPADEEQAGAPADEGVPRVVELRAPGAPGLDSYDSGRGSTPGSPQP